MSDARSPGARRGPKAPPPPGALDDFRDSGFFVLRTSILSVDELVRWSDGQEALACAENPEALEGAWTRDLRMLKERLRAVMTRPAMREALFLASPELEERVSAWLADPAAECSERVVRSLVRYFSRMAGRCTPFGLFAGCSTGRIGDATRLEVAHSGACTRRTRLDMGFLNQLVEDLQGDADLRSRLVFRPNSSLHRTPDQIRFAETRYQERERSYHLVAADLDTPLVRVLDRCERGARRDELIDLLVDPGIERTEAVAYVDELIAARILVPDLEPALTGGDGLAQLVETLEAAACEDGTVAMLRAVQDDLAAIDASGIGVAPERYRTTVRRLRERSPRLDPKELFQVDLVRPAPDAVLSRTLLPDLAAGLDTLLRLTADRTRHDAGSLATFRRQFTDRYGKREVPLLEALDEEIGIGFQASTAPNAEASPLLRDLAFPTAPRGEAPWTVALEFIVPHLATALATGVQEIELHAEDLERLPRGDPDRIPDSMFAIFVLLASGPDAIERGEYRLSMRGTGGPSGARLFGRFCHMDPDLLDRVRRYLEDEEQLVPDAVFAEIVHLPQGRTGNVLARPLLRRYEIPFLARSGADAGHRIPLQDLVVSVRGDRIVLRSMRLDREVIPRMTTAHNFTSSALGPYHFLCRLQTQHCSEPLFWQWGPLESLPFLPGIRIGRVEIARPRWLLDVGTIQALEAESGPRRFAEVQRVRRERRMPRFLGVVDGDNVLPIDLDNALSVDTLVDLVAGRSSAILRAMEDPLRELPAQGPEGRFAHEILVPLVRASRSASQEARVRAVDTARPAPAGSPRHGPGSAWIYLKLYTGTATVDRILREELPPLVRAAQEEELVDRWFFLRFSDPEFHLRVRLRAVSTDTASEVRARAERLFLPLISRGRIWRLQYDTYDPEQARYGGPKGLDLAERLFHVDSDAVLHILAGTRGDEGLDQRWRLCLVGMDRLMQNLDFDLPARHRVITQSSAEFDHEFKVDGRFRHAVRDRFRRERRSLEALLAQQEPLSEVLRGGLELLEQRSRALAPIAADLRLADRRGELEQPLERLAGSYLHLHANRMLRGAHRAQEMLIYHFMERLYDSRRAQEGRALVTAG